MFPSLVIYHTVKFNTVSAIFVATEIQSKILETQNFLKVNSILNNVLYIYINAISLLHH